MGEHTADIGLRSGTTGMRYCQNLSKSLGNRILPGRQDSYTDDAGGKPR
jgi:hypothetical protein